MKKELIYIDGKNKTEEIKSYEINGDKCIVIYRKSDKGYTYNINKVQIVKSAIKSKNAENVFYYLKDIANAVGIPNDNGGNILTDMYDRISFIPESSILCHFLNGSTPKTNANNPLTEMFPFGFNLSQKSGVHSAFSNQLSIIEGPPGTGKTQTILNIIANAVVQGQSVAVVSSNNSAIINVYEKLLKNDLAFFAAPLGRKEYRQEFIKSQPDLPNLSDFELTIEETKSLKESNKILFDELNEKLSHNNELATLKLEIENIKTEHQHFLKNQTQILNIAFRKNISSDQLLAFWIKIENLEMTNRKLNWWKKLIFSFLYGVKDKSLYQLSYTQIIELIQSAYYPTKIGELSARQKYLEDSLSKFSFNNKMKDFTNVSMQLFKGELFKMYKKNERIKYIEAELRTKSEQFLKDYPVVLSTAYSLKKCLNENIIYDIVIVDESSQVDLATGALVLSCAQNAVIVGDLKQLSNVITSETIQKTDKIFDSYKLKDCYDYSKNNLLSSLAKLFPNIPRTLLREHYRCHPKIIEFCNRKFYNNELIILTEGKTERKPLIVHRTVEGNHARSNINQRQIDVIDKEVIPQQNLENVDLGIVTPYRKQTEAMQKHFEKRSIKIDTVDKFQGGENDVIILATVDNQITDFTDNVNRLNVAISRAIDQLILVIHGNDDYGDTNVADLIRYIDYNNFDIINSEIRSIFDYLYKGYEQKKREILSQSNKISAFDSENLTYILIKSIISEDRFAKYDVLVHFPLRNLILDYSKLTSEEEKYAKHHLTHLDFIIYNKLGKNIVLAVEVDGHEYHQENTKQQKRDLKKNSILDKYKIPLVRLSTTGSGEREKIMQSLFDDYN